MNIDTIANLDALAYARTLPDASVNCIVTSPPYFGLRDYGIDGQIGLEPTPAEYVRKLADLFAELRRVLRHDGVAWLNLGDSYAGGGRGGNPADSLYQKQATSHDSLSVQHTRLDVDGLPHKSLMGIPWRVAFALQDAGWILRSDIIWAKANPMPESVQDRPTRAHEYIFLLTKSPRYWYDAAAIAEPVVSDGGGDFTRELQDIQPEHGGKSRTGKWARGNRIVTTRNKRSVWQVNPQPFAGAHFAAFPPKLIEPMILAGCPAGGVVYDPFMGSGTTALVARRLGRHFVGSELNPEYVAMAGRRLAEPYTVDLFASAAQVDAEDVCQEALL